MSSLLEKIIVSSVDVSSFPKAAVEIYFFVLEVDGGRTTFELYIKDPLCLATMCASLALTDAGINLYGLLGCSCVVLLE